MMLHIPVHLRRLSTCRVLENLANPADSIKLNRSVKGKQGPVIKPKIGLEVHAQLNTSSKLFSKGENCSQAAPNSHLDLLDVSIPGTLPVLNGFAVRAAMTTALGLNCTIQDVIHFDRKNYFYPDMPAGYQITQYNNPIARGGYIEFIVRTYHNSIIAHSQRYDIVKYLYHHDRMLDEEFVPYMKRSQIKQLQLEQDSAKTLSDDPNFSLIDYNRSGAGLIEIVFEPDLVSPHEASSLVKELICILKQLNTCDCELQEGSLRVDANVSITSIDNQDISQEHGGRVELKNLNSLRSLTKGLASEIKRQATELMAGRQVHQESRTYDTRAGRTTLLRAKETAIDYRYVPEPSIPPLVIDQSLVEDVRKDFDKLTLSHKMRENLQSKYNNLDLILIAELLDEPGLADYFHGVMRGTQFNANVVADFLIYAVANLKHLDRLPLEVNLTNPKGDFMTRLSPEKVRGLFEMMFADEIGFATAYEVMKCLFTSDSPSEPRELIEQLGWFQSRDEEAMGVACDKLIKGMKNISKQYSKKGDRKYLRMMLEKLSEQADQRLNIKLAIKCLDDRLRVAKDQ